MKGDLKASVWEKHEAVGSKWKEKKDRKWVSSTFYLVHYSSDLHKVFRLIGGKLVQVGKVNKLILSCPQCRREKKEGKKDRQLSFFEK